jgi:hypothetical protein
MDNTKVPEADKKRASGIDPALTLIMILLVSFTIICKLKDTNTELLMRQAETSMVESWDQSLSLNATTGGHSEAKTTEQQSALTEKVETEKNLYRHLRIIHSRLIMGIMAIFVAFLLFAVSVPFQKRWMFITAAVPAVYGMAMGTLGLLG